MYTNSNSLGKTKKIVMLAIFTAIVIVLQLLGQFISFGSFSISLVLIPIVVGAAICGPGAGAFLGAVFGIVVTITCITGMDKGGFILFSANPFLTVLTCVLKGTLAGWLSGLVYAHMSKINNFAAVVLAAIVCPVVNTGIFCVALALLFHDILIEWAGGTSIVYYFIFSLVGVNFLLEMVVNVVLSPIAVRIIKAGKSF